jgi:hypothetical protein
MPSGTTRQRRQPDPSPRPRASAEARRRAQRWLQRLLRNGERGEHRPGRRAEEVRA